MPPAPPRTHLAMYPGSFDPMTYGHLDVIRRARRLFDELVVGVGRNPGKAHLFTQEDRVDIARALIDELIKTEDASAEPAAPVRVIPFSGLTADFATHIRAAAIVRGIRNLSDLQNEVQQAITNREVAGLETVFIVAGQTFAYTSSSLIKQITAMGADLRALSTMVPPLVVQKLKAKRDARDPMLMRLLAEDE